MTEAEAKRLFNPMLLKCPDLVWHKRWVYLRPVSHVARAFRMDGTLGKTAVRPIWGGNLMCRSPAFDGVQWFRELFSETAQYGRYDTDDPDAQEQLLLQFETLALTGLESIGELGRFLEFTSTFGTRSLGKYDTYKVFVDAAYGRLDAARAICERFLSRHPNWRTSTWENQGRPMIDELYPLLLEENVEAIAALLRRYELDYVNAYGLASIHEPTPFPLEQ